ncbi:hypothetical protein AALM74_21520 [Parabacteroides segnis]|jgi:hypothetical protein|uniref:Uncharacterized protein n=1 Tax=Parabacteroides segnis TaxID=2763058 RepID=A0ABR7EAX5_9BACT|nr:MULTISPECIES: hypothetical protein [Parabacteroides]MBC5646264.1 hypothetical protein [Parabacteroides segnis]MCM0716595.1 hypothetical protein [Parabacteroides sp. TA-V-105]
MYEEKQTAEQIRRSNTFEKVDRYQKYNLMDNRANFLHQHNLTNLIQRETCPKQVFSQLSPEKVIQRVPLDQFIINMSKKEEKEDIYLYGHIASDGFGDMAMINNLEQVLERHKDPLKITNIVKIATLDNDDEAAGKKERIMRDNYNFRDVQKVNQYFYSAEHIFDYIFCNCYNHTDVTASDPSDVEVEYMINELRQYDDAEIIEFIKKIYDDTGDYKISNFITDFKQMPDNFLANQIICSKDVSRQLFYPAYGARKKIETLPFNESNWEIHCSIPDLETMQDFYASPQFTVISEMGKIHTFEYYVNSDSNKESSYTTLLTPERSAGLMLPNRPSTECKQTNIPTGLLEFINIQLDEYMNNNKFTEDYALINIRRADNGKYRPNIDTILDFVSKISGPQKLILLGVSDIGEEPSENICCIETLDPGVLQHFLTKMTSNSIVLSGGEGLLCEALGLSEAQAMLIPRYEYHYRALLNFGKMIGKENEVRGLIINSLATVGMSLETLNDYLEKHSDPIIPLDSNTEIPPNFLRELSSKLKGYTLDSFIKGILESQQLPSS